MSNTLEVLVSDVFSETDSIKRYELRAEKGELPAFTAGAHVDLHLPGGLIRSYSLLNSQSERDRYVIAVALEVESRGGSRYIHSQIEKGATIKIGEPRNLFSLQEAAPRSILFGGGIGVTPMLSMASRLNDLGHSWKLFYCGRSRQTAAFLDVLSKYGDHVELRFDDEQPEFIDFGAIMATTPTAHFYCCGPKGMMAAFKAAADAQGIPSEQVHIEYFQPPADLDLQGGFEVELKKSGRIVQIPAGKSILHTLEDAGIATTSSCEAGICGECTVTVLEGIPDHKDHVLTDAERASNKVMMICCSGSKSGRLVLDL